MSNILVFLVGLFFVASCQTTAQKRMSERDAVVLLGVSPYDSIGTGFRFEWGGKKYIGTATHICAYFPKMFVFGDDGATQVKVVKFSKEQDFCVLETDWDGPAFPIAGSSSEGESIYTMGHPASVPFMYKSGELLGTMSAMTLYPFRGDPKDCPGEVAMGVAKVMSCWVQSDFLVANFPVEHGQSGSPLLNSSGEVIGVLSQLRNNASLWSPVRNLLVQL